MNLSSGTLNLFGGAAIAIATAFSCAWMLKHPAEVRVIREAAYKHLGISDPFARNRGDTAESQLAEQQRLPGEVILTAKSYGHFETEAEVNGRAIDVMVDTGATLVALTYEDAERAGLYLRPADFTQRVATANGEARIAPVSIDRITIGDITLHNVEGAVSERGKLHRTLLGMSFLGRLSRVDMRSDRLVLAE